MYEPIGDSVWIWNIMVTYSKYDTASYNKRFKLTNVIPNSLIRDTGFNTATLSWNFTHSVVK